MSDIAPSAPPPGQTVLRVHHGVLIDAPIVAPWGSRPWAATVWRDDRSAGGWGRAVMAPSPGGRGYMTNGLTPGDVIEFGADYRTQTGRNKHQMVPYRWYGVVLATDPDYVVALGPFATPEPARQWAERAMQAWRQSVLVDIPGVTDLTRPTQAITAPRDAQPVVSPVEVRADHRVTRVDDPTHGTLLADTTLFAAAMTMDRDRLVELLTESLARNWKPLFTGDEPKVTLAALAAIHVPDSLAVEGVDVAEAVTEPLPVNWADGATAVFYGHPDGTVELAQRDRETSVLAPSQQWTPDGFAWGYDGDSPRELAYSLLLAATGRRDVAGRHSERYAAEVVAALPQGEAWSLPVTDVATWAATAAQRRSPVVAASRPVPSRRRDRGRDAGAGL